MDFDPLRDDAVSHPVGSDCNNADHKQSPAVSGCLEVVHVTSLRVGLLVLECLLDLLTFELNERVVLVPVGVVLAQNLCGFLDLALLPEPLGGCQLRGGHDQTQLTLGDSGMLKVMRRAAMGPRIWK